MRNQLGNTVLFFLIATIGLFSPSVSGVQYNPQNGAYTDIVFAIGDDVNETEGRTIINKIQEGMAAASEVLKVATKQMKVFAEVKILIPSSWTMEGNSTNETFETADIRVSHNLITDAPYVLGVVGCGKTRPDVHMAFKPGFVTQGKAFRYGLFEKTFVHEWGHVRWGLLDEYTDNTRKAKFSVNSQTYQIEAIGCTRELKYKLIDKTGRSCTVDKQTGVYTSTCQLVYKKDQTSTASIMNYQHLDSVIHFCDDTDDSKLKHNRDAPSQHNNECNSRSAWEVMRTHPDFRTSVQSLYSGPIKFSIIKADKMRSTVFVFDTSGSMLGRKISELHSTATNMINNTLADGLLVGLVKFASSATVLKDLTELSNQTRSSIVAAVPTNIADGTSIGAGLRTALQMLKSSPKGSRGSTIILISGSKETTYPFIQNLKPDIVSAGVIVTSILFTSSAEQSLISLSEETGGVSYFTEGLGSSTSLSDVFTEIAENLNQKVSNSTFNTIPIASLTFSVVDAQTCKNFTIDPSANQKTKFTVAWYSNTAPQIMMISPSGSPKTYTSGNSKTITLLCDSEPCEVGTWHICLRSPTLQQVQVEVQSQQDTSDSNQPITLSTKIYNKSPDFSQGKDKVEIFAEVLKGNRVVVGAKVYAEIEALGEKITLNLEDTGSGADFERGDGTYSGYLFSTGTKSRYSVIVKVVGLRDEIFTEKYIDSLYADDSSMDRVMFGEDFERYSVVGFFTPVGMADPKFDFIPPAKIVDLTIKEISPESDRVTLTWTAVGDDFDKRDVSHYEVMMFNTTAEFRNSSFNGTRVYPLQNPAVVPPYQTVEMTLSLNGSNMSLFSVRAVDDAGLAGKFSFPVTVTTLNLAPPTLLGIEINALVIGLSIGAGIFTLLIILAVLILVRKKCGRKCCECRREAESDQRLIE